MNCRLQVVLRIFAGYVVLHANKVHRKIKNRTGCFQERFRLLSLAAVLRKHPSWFQNPIDIVFWNRNVCFLRTGRSQNPENKSVQFFIYPRLCSMQYPSCENPSIQVTSGSNQSLNSGRCALLWLANRKALRMTEFSRHLLYRHSSHNREFHNVNCRFCGAIHSVNWACISVLSQVIRNVNERKTVQTNMISFVSHGDKTL